MRKKAIIFIDMQLGNFQSPNPVFESDRLIDNSKIILDQARKDGEKIFFIQNNGNSGDIDEQGTGGWEIHPRIKPKHDEQIILKITPDSFYETELDKKLKQENIETIVILGLQTEYCIDTTVRRAFSLGYKVNLLKDCHSTWDSEFLTAKQIIHHHNLVLGDFFAVLISMCEFLKE